MPSGEFRDPSRRSAPLTPGGAFLVIAILIVGKLLWSGSLELFERFLRRHLSDVGIEVALVVATLIVACFLYSVMRAA